MKGRLFTLILSLFLTLGLAFGQADQDAGGAVGDEPAQEAPVGDDAAGQDMGQDAAPGDDAAEQEGDATEDGAADDAVDQPAGEDATDEGMPGDDATEEGMPGDDATEEGVAGGGQADMAAQGVVEALQSNPDFSMFADAVQRAGLDMTLEQEGPFTILAPTNQAFEQAGIDLASLDQQALSDLVRNHIISGMVSADQLSTLAGVVTLLGNELAVAPGTDQTVAGAEQEGEVAGGGAAEPGQEEEPAAPDQAEEQPGDVDPAQDAAADRPMGQPGADGAMGLQVGEATITHGAIETSSGVIYGVDTVLVPEGVAGGGAAQPAAPETEEPMTPEEPTTPDTEEPATPGAEEPATPGTEEPATPDTEEPTTPGAEEEPAAPTTPDTDTPATDDAGMGEDTDTDDAGTDDDGTDDAGTDDTTN